MNIHIVHQEDWQKFRDIRLYGLKNDPQAFVGDFSEILKRTELDWWSRLKGIDSFFFAAEENSIFVSIAGAKRTSDTKWMLIAVHTLKANRGTGLAQQVIDKVFEELRKRGVMTVELIVNTDQKDAVHIYEKLGFRTIKILDGELMGDGKLHEGYSMEKML